MTGNLKNIKNWWKTKLENYSNTHPKTIMQIWPPEDWKEQIKKLEKLKDLERQLERLQNSQLEAKIEVNNK